MGWGYTSPNSKNTDDLQELNLKVLKNEDCSNYGHSFDPVKMICAGYVEGDLDACRGDSGGPLVCPTKDNPEQYVIEGIVSFGQGCAEKGYPGIYARVSNYVDWIQQHADHMSSPDSSNYRINHYQHVILLIFFLILTVSLT